ncbi:hypothetical protein L1987_11917 [Smallanthus sonchifolius]|uniref:Uncharacterized protein n=1 Tax=Smallanthus sonchifolius TaxID=185202 RepID=A0ACB9JCS7_9ASTR|nr:hypothetical protein L1987_11917 [Smallanthus sonchifolius]
MLTGLGSSGHGMGFGRNGTGRGGSRSGSGGGCDGSKSGSGVGFIGLEGWDRLLDLPVGCFGPAGVSELGWWCCGCRPGRKGSGRARLLWGRMRVWARGRLGRRCGLGRSVRRSRKGLRKGKHSLIKNDVSRDNDSVGFEVKAFVPPMVGGEIPGSRDGDARDLGIELQMRMV